VSALLSLNKQAAIDEALHRYQLLYSLYANAGTEDAQRTLVTARCQLAEALRAAQWCEPRINYYMLNLHPNAGNSNNNSSSSSSSSAVYTLGIAGTAAAAMAAAGASPGIFMDPE
jgi:hypothetical protein